MSSTSRITTSILQSYYPTVRDLQSYLLEILEPPATSIGFPLLATDSERFKAFISGTQVALTRQSVSLPGRGGSRLKVEEPIVHMRDIIDRAQEKLMSKKAPNIITAGYRSAYSESDRGKPGMMRLGVSNYFVNTTVTALQGPEWERLLKRIGEDAMFHLLTETCLFAPLPNDCLCQMTGEPIVYMKVPPFKRALEPAAAAAVDERIRAKRKAQGQPKGSEARKRMRLADGSAASSRTNSANALFEDKSTVNIRTAADVSIARSRLFYARPSFVPHKHHIIVGLPSKHILNTLNPSYYQKHSAASKPYEPPDQRKQMQDARHLSKYVFPRMYALSNAFILPASSNYKTYIVPNFEDREAEIKLKGKCKTPKRLASVIGHLEKLIYRHGKCRYKSLRDLACPSKLRDEQQKIIDSSVILELVSEQSIRLKSQQSLTIANQSIDSLGCTIIPRGATQARMDVKSKPRFTEFTCSHFEVFRYAVLVTKVVIPKALWGSDRNFRLVMNSVKNFITFRRYETLTVHQIVQGLSTSECEWLVLNKATYELRKNTSVSDSLKRRELLEEFLFWYFSSFLLPLLRTSFYATESSAFRNRILYFRQDDWQALCAPLIERLSSNTFLKLEETEAEEILRQRKLGFSFVRLLPKDTGVRPIVNLRRKRLQQKGSLASNHQSINNILQAAFQILTYEKNAQPHLLGSSVFGPNEIYGQLKAYKSRLAFDNPAGKLPKLYFVKVDVQACFDTIEQTKLLQILQDAISEDSYMLQRFGQVTQGAGKIKRKFVKKATSGDEHPHFVRYASQLADLLRNAIFVDQVVYPFSKKQEILELLQEHITENIVKIGQDYYRQIVGIPQGSVLSALLCSFFYGDLEREHLKFTKDQGSVLLRLIDDYLFITTDITKARHFLNVMNKGHSEYGCFISREKTLTNFDYDSQIMNVTSPNQRSFPWCGFLINMSDLSVTADYGRYHDTYVVDSLTVERGRRAGVAFLNKMLQLAKSKSHIIYCDTDLNSEHVVYFNLYQNFLLVAMKMHHYLKCWGTNVHRNASFIYNTIQQVIRYTYATVRNKASNKVALANAGRCGVQKASLIWLGTKAFHTIFSQKPTAYSALIKLLSHGLKKGPHSKRLRRLVIEAGAMIAQLSF